MKILVPFAEGFEEAEGITIVDILRRAQLEVTTAFLGKNPVTGSHGIPVTADKSINELKLVDFQCIILPGGMPGSAHLKENDHVISFIKHIFSTGGTVGALCAAPMVLGHAGILYGKKATCFPGFEGEMEGARFENQPVVVDGTVITGKGMGCAVPFALRFVELFKGKEAAEDIKNRLQVYWM